MDIRRTTNLASRRSRSLLALVAVASVLCAAHPADATATVDDGYVTVNFGLRAGSWWVSDTSAACQLSVVLDADGVEVLDAAVAKGCIASYETETWNWHPSRPIWVRCINDVCNRRDHLPSSSSSSSSTWESSEPLSHFRAVNDSELVVSYITEVDDGLFDW